MLPKTSDVVIVGGGVMGASVAYHLAERGGVSVTLLEQEEQFGQGSTGRCAGGIRHQFSTEVNIRLSIESIRMLERFPQEIGQEIGLNQIGYLFVLDDERDFEQFKRNVILQNSLGIESRVLSVAEIQQRVPLLNLEGIVGGTIYERDGLADPNSIVQGYINKTRQLGRAGARPAPTLLNKVLVTGVRLTEGGKVQAVVTNEGEIATETLVIAAGAWSGKLGEMIGVDIPIQPLRRQIAVTTPLPQLPLDFPFVLFFGQSLYFHPESGQSILTGKSNNAEPVGFNTEVDASWTELHLLEAMQRFPLLEQAGLLSEWAGLYEVTPDEQAILGWLPVEGVVIAAGFSGHGFMHGPIVGKLMAEEILDGRAHTVNIDDLRYERFALGKDVSEYNIV